MKSSRPGAGSSRRRKLKPPERLGFIAKPDGDIAYTHAEFLEAFPEIAEAFGAEPSDLQKIKSGTLLMKWAIRFQCNGMLHGYYWFRRAALIVMNEEAVPVSRDESFRNYEKEKVKAAGLKGYFADE